MFPDVRKYLNGNLKKTLPDFSIYSDFKRKAKNVLTEHYHGIESVTYGILFGGAVFGIGHLIRWYFFDMLPGDGDDIWVAEHLGWGAGTWFGYYHLMKDKLGSKYAAVQATLAAFLTGEVIELKEQIPRDMWVDIANTGIGGSAGGAGGYCAYSGIKRLKQKANHKDKETIDDLTN